MEDDEQPETEPKPKPKPKARKPQRVTLVHRDMAGEAQPYDNALDPWFAAGWVKKSAGNAD